MLNSPPRRPRPFNPKSNTGFQAGERQLDEKALRADGQAQAHARQVVYEQSLVTANGRHVPNVRDAVEIQAYILRKAGANYAEVGRVLEVGLDTARMLVAEGAKRCVDEDPVTSLRLHLGRIEGLLEEWYRRAFVLEGLVRDVDSGLFVDAEAHARVNGEFVLKILAMQEKIGTWLATLPRRGQERKDEDDHAEIKAILLRADDYGPPPGPGGTTPHGLPALADWRPADVEDEHG